MSIARIGSYSSLVRHWYMLFVATLILVILLLVYHMSPFEQGQVQMMAVDPSKLSKNDSQIYPLEAALMQLFPARVTEVMDELDKYKSYPVMVRPMWAKWRGKQLWSKVLSTTPRLSKGETCSAAELPLPLLRHMVAKGLNITDTIDDHVIDKPFLYLSTAGSDLCVRAIIPEPPAEAISPYHYFYQPNNTQQLNLKSPWWDSLMVSAQHLDTGASFPLHMEPWSGHKILRDEWYKRWKIPHTPKFAQDMECMMQERKSIHIYEAKVSLVDPGRHIFDAKLEYQEGQWNFEKGHIVPYDPQNMTVYPYNTFLAQDPKDEVEHENYTESIVRRHMSLPLCTKADLPGRWLPGDAVPQDMPQPAALDRYGKFWAPFTCRLQRVSYENYGACLASKYPQGMDTFGDSNMRRSIKKILTHGRWCDDWHLVNADALKQYKGNKGVTSNSTDPINWDYVGEESQLRSCYCEDYQENGWNKAWFNPFERRSKLWIGNQTTGITLRNYKLDGLSHYNSPGWDTIITGVNSTYGLGDIAIFSLGNWDTAYMTVELFRSELDRLIKIIHERYNKKQIVYRTAQYYCCRTDETDRRRLLSGPRIQLFNQLAREKFTQEFQAIIWDPTILGESRTWEEKIESKNCPSNHVSADVVEVENQVLMNALCNGT